MPDNEVHIVRQKYGIDDQKKEKHATSSSSIRNHDRERTILIGALEKISKLFQKQMAQGDFVLDDDSRYIEEFCTLIELSLQHGWKGKSCFWVVLENYSKKNPSKGSNQSAYDIVRNHLSLPNNISKLRAWIRISLTKKFMVMELKKSIDIVKKIDECYYKWSIMRNDTLNTLLSVIESLNRIDFNLLVKESTLNLLETPINWIKIIDSSGNINLDMFAPYLSLSIEEETNFEDFDKVLVRHVGFLEDENIRLRRSVLQQMNQSARSDVLIEELSVKLSESKKYSLQLEEEVQRLQKIKFELEERISAHEMTNKSLLNQFNNFHK